MTTYFFVPCGGAKLSSAAPARQLYTGSAFRHILNAAEGEAAATTRDLHVETEVLILSALHGLVTLDEVLEPYDVKMGDSGSITALALAEQLGDHGIEYGDEIYAMLPKAYLRTLTAAAELLDIAVQNMYEAAPFIGHHRGVASTLIRHQDTIGTNRRTP